MNEAAVSMLPRKGRKENEVQEFLRMAYIDMNGLVAEVKRRKIIDMFSGESLHVAYGRNLSKCLFKTTFMG